MGSPGRAVWFLVLKRTICCFSPEEEHLVFWSWRGPFVMLDLQLLSGCASLGLLVSNWMHNEMCLKNMFNKPWPPLFPSPTSDNRFLEKGVCLIQILTLFTGAWVYFWTSVTITSECPEIKMNTTMRAVQFS